MSKVNIANYVVYDLANRFNLSEHNPADTDLVGMVADEWHKKHFVSGKKEIKFHHNEDLNKTFII